METFEKMLSPVVIIVLNLVVIVAALATGDLFLKTGLIHAFALFFIALSVIRIFVRYYSYDQFLEKFFHAAVVTFLVFALSHFVEFFSYRILSLPDEVTFTNVANFYIVGLLILTIGAERFLRVHDSRSAGLVWILSVVVAAFAVPIAGLYTHADLISLKPDGFGLYIYILMSVAVTCLALWKIGRIGKLVSISTSFTRFMKLAIVLVTLSILVDLLYEVFEDSTLQVYQIIYLSHFLFYGGMSLIFLAFGTLRIIKKTGLYARVQELEKNS